MAQILDICLQADTSKTRIIYKANMNFNTINPHLESLIKRGLLEVIPCNGLVYRTTPKGKNVLEDLRAIEDMIVG